ncbi:histidine kinase CKI1-like protein [Tanacetum coccineum]
MGGEISIVDNKVGKKGTCFAFSVVLDVCLSNSRNIHEDDKTLSSGSTTPLRSPKRLDDNSSIVVIFISSDERRRVIQEFLRAHKIKVLAVKNIVELSQTLRKLKQEQEKVSSSKSYLNKSFGCLSWPRSRSSNTSPKNVPLSAMDGTDVSPTQSTNSLTLSSFILLVLDTTRANFRELSKVVAEFRKDSKNESFRVVWLGSRCIKLQGLDENQLPPSDLIIPMPVHGTRLNSLINLLPEFGGMFPSTPPHQNQPTPREVEETQIITRDEQTLRKQEGPTEITKSSPLRGEKVLLADNEPCQHMIVQKLLSRYGVTTTSCLNGKQALDILPLELLIFYHMTISLWTVQQELPSQATAAWSGSKTITPIQEEDDTIKKCMEMLPAWTGSKKAIPTRNGNNTIQECMELLLRRPAEIQRLASKFIERPKRDDQILVMSHPGMYVERFFEYVEYSSLLAWMTNSCLDGTLIHWWAIYLYGCAERRFPGHNKCAILNPSLVHWRMCRENNGAPTMNHIQQTFAAHKDKTIFIAPYLQDSHWVLFIICPLTKTGYILDSSNRNMRKTPRLYKLTSIVERTCKMQINWTMVKCHQQEADWECGYYVSIAMFQLMFRLQEDFPADLWEDMSPIEQKHIDEWVLSSASQFFTFYLEN